MKLSYSKQKDMFISLDLYLQQEGPFMVHFTMFFHTLEENEQKMWKQVMSHIQSGVSYEESIESVKPFIDPSVFPMMILLGSHPKPHAMTHMIIERLQHIIDRKILKQKVLRYPQLLSLLLVMFIILYLTVMVPMYEGMFETYDYNTTQMMQMMMSLSRILRENPLIVLLITVFSLLFIKGLSYVIRRYMPHLKYKVIGFKSLSLKHVYMDFTYVLSTYLNAHLTFKEALEQTLLISSSYLSQGIIEGIQKLNEGKPFIQSFEKLPQYPKDMEKLLMHAQEEKQLIDILTILSKRYHMQYEKQLEIRYQALTPILMVILGSVILFMFYMVYAPILNMYDIISV